MSKVQYNLLLSLIKEKLKKNIIRKPIDPECRLVITLIYLSQGVSKHYIAWTFRIGVSTIRNIIYEVCDVLWQLLSPVYMAPSTITDWKKNIKEFYEKWQMPNCLGSIDGKHVQVKCPPNSGSQYFNYKGHFSVVLLGVCDANYVFTAVDVGAYGSQSGGGIFRESQFGRKLLNNDLNVPPSRKLPNSEKVTRCYFVGDSAFPLRNNLMRPYPGILLEEKKNVFNKRMSRARRVIENAFGILTTRWRVMLNCIECHPKNVDKIVLACVILHNFLKITDDIYNCHTYSPPNFCDSYDDENNLIKGAWRQENVCLESIRKVGSENSTREAFAIRETLANYFLIEGRIHQLSIKIIRE